MRSTGIARGLALTAGLATAGPAVAAEVEIDGRLQVGYTYFHSSGQGHGGTIGDDKGQSRIGIAARQTIAGSTAAIGRAEVGLDPDTFGNDDDDSSNPFRAREAWVGIQGTAGQLRAGRLPGAYKQAGGIHWDLMNATELQQRRAGGMTGGAYGNDGFINSLVEYRTHSLAGIELLVQYGFDDRSDDDVDRSGDDLLVGGIYREGPWELIGAYSRDDSLPAGENRNWKLGARFDTGEASLAYQYEKVRVRDQVDDASVERDSGTLTLNPITPDETFDFDTRHHMVGMSQTYGMRMLWLAWGYMDADDDDFDIYNYTIALNRLFSQGMRWYTGVQYQDRGRGYESRHLTVFTTGLRFDF
ncbi:porin [Aquisalimonas sp.]|uniref:porin n=1 Tax=unclassified Aquisalimonas TaxID=2644645 RepID=UPI0025BC86A3|nr:porin [Aquisalimonas sp.]